MRPVGSVNIILDLVVFFLPIPKVLKLNASIHKRIGVCLTFLVGLFVTFVSIFRLQKLVVHINTSNPTWDLNPIAIWSQAEVNVGKALFGCPVTSAVTVFGHTNLKP
jgi:hypothetical protein